MLRQITATVLIIMATTVAVAGQKYRDGRPAATLRLNAKDHGIVLRYGNGPDKCDMLGARDVWVFEEDGTCYMHYDAPGGSSTSQMKRNIGLAWLELPLTPVFPKQFIPRKGSSGI